MLFRKNIEPSCSYCAHGSQISDEEVICIKKGLSAPWEECRKFHYDPFKRKPAKPQSLKTSGIKAEDFVI